MLRGIIGAIIGISILIGGGLYLKNSIQSEKITENARNAVEILHNPWIEVSAPSAFELKRDKTPSRELKTGDEVLPGTTIEVSSKGLASIHFQDGSIARLDSGTRLAIDEATYDAGSEKLSVKMNLIVGRIWSKVVALVTPDSEWQVKTTNAVATVRGTAFGSEFKNGRSSFIGSQHAVAVNIIDPKTRELIKDAVAIVEPDKFVWVEDKKIEDIKKGRVKFETQPITEELKKENWIQRSEEADVRFEETLQKLEQSGLKDKDLRNEMRKEIIDEFKNKIEEQKIQRENEEHDKEALEQQKINIDTTPTPEKIEISEPVNVSPIPTSLRPEATLEIIANNDFKNVIEGTLISFHAIFISASGERRDVTAEVEWKVLGPIGRFEKPGAFMPRLADEVSEFGIAPGAVVATWKNPITGTTLINKSPIFNVNAKVEALPPDIQG
ncbi:MAG: FecR domain-containing protein [Patescibacteria group bacterium]